jgi:hypothetical protein
MNIIMNTVKVQKLSPPADLTALQPLREIGHEEKTQFWDLDDIYDALREAHRLGVPPEKFFNSGPSSENNSPSVLSA